MGWGGSWPASLALAGCGLLLTKVRVDTATRLAMLGAAWADRARPLPHEAGPVRLLACRHHKCITFA